jgi:NADH:ubiquinone oxidoreductase subunit F (NADH-binding)/NADH:ubiquinone oxidoreductase subunit E
MRRSTAARQPIDPEIVALVERYDHDPEAILAVFQELQTRRGGLSRKSVDDVARALHLPAARAYSVASFYSMLTMPPRPGRCIRVCDGPACLLQHGQAAREAIETVAEDGEWRIERSSCLGLCDRAPAALVDGRPHQLLTPDPIGRVRIGWRADRPAYAEPLPGETRVTLARLGQIDPDSIDSAISAGAYTALGTALRQTPLDVLSVVDTSGLQGRGGAGFPTARKWRFVAQAQSAQKHVVCNFDESEPGTFKDRVLGEGDPHLLLEGMALAAYAIGASVGFIYIRGEYEWIAQRLERAIAQAEERGWLGAHIQGGDFSFKIHVHRGAGAYICGEETALLESLEGKRGEPRIRPPYPATRGYRGQPTIVNNVETLCCVAPIVLRGAEWYRSLGTANSPGTKLFTVTGHVNRPGVFEAPFGVTLRQIVEHFGGGMRAGSNFNLALTGGAAGTIVPASLLDVPLDYASGRQGVSLGSGAMLILDESASAVTLLGWLLRFFEAESCGKCTPCREGTREARIIVERIADGQGRAGDVDELKRLARMLGAASFCGLGQSAAWPIESALRHFGDEFEAHSGTRGWA